ncbi:M60 family metallopeptidase [Adlercreutzia murintestinalis]|uniref:M60 family metallopeptidase n=1 Tax=Adlercreutzia murintestinalis TaxID=2941325 RepID=UPI00203E08A6|nr:M60 family metallopeptidase [Adlercreutzia murintestinalis]
MKRTSNRILSVMVSAALACSLFGAPAIAAATEDTAAAQGSETASVITEEATADSDVTYLDDEGKAIDPSENQEGTTEQEVPDSSSTVAVPAAKTTTDDEGIAAIAEAQTDSTDPGNTTANTAKSSVLVTVHYDFPYEGADPLAFTLTLKDETRQKERAYPVTLTGRSGAYSATYELTPFIDKMLVSGNEYSITLTGDTFITYNQEKFTYDGDNDMSIEVYAAGVELGGFEEGKKPGIMQGGNLTRGAEDDQVDNADVRVLLNAIEGDTSQDADLNGDGKVDLVDYQLMAEFYRYVSSQADVNGSTTTKTPVDTLGAAANDNTWVTKEGNTARIASRDGEEVSPENEIAVRYEAPANTISTSTTVGMPMATDNNNIEGYATVEGEELDENGNPTGRTLTETYDFSSAATSSAAQRATMVGNALQAPRTMGDAVQLTEVSAAVRALGDPLLPTVVEDGRITINFGKRIAVKTVTLTFTRAQVYDEESNLISANLVEISSVEFLNNMEDHVAEPEFTKTEIVGAEAGNKEFTVTWKFLPNVTGYEILVTDTETGKTQTYNVGNSTGADISKTITSFAAGPKGKLANKVTYQVQVRPTNGSWRGEYTDAVSVTPKATKVPTKPEKVAVVGGYRMFKVSWGAAEEADTYTLYYREGTSGSYLKIEAIEGLNYTVSNLPDKATSYQLYLTATNEIGEGPASSTATVQTTSLTPVNLPNYMLLNSKTANGAYTTNIASARFTSTNSAIEDPNGVNSAASNAMCLFDGDFKSYAQVNDWDLGTSYNRNTHGVDVTFTSPQEVGMITFAASSENIDYGGVKVLYKTADAPTTWQTASASILSRKANDNRTYSLIKLDQGVTCTEMLIGVNRYVRLINIAEMRFHGYNDIEARIASMYDADDELADLRIKLGDQVETTAYGVADTWYKKAEAGQRSFEELVDNLRKELNEYKSNDELYPFQSSALTELTYIEKLLKDESAGMKDVVKVHTDLSDAYDSGRALGISGLNAWQPLGVSVSAGEKITVYAGAPKGANSATKIDLYVGQYEGESSQTPHRIGTFRLGRTELTIGPGEFSSVDKKEHGGQLYAVYTGNNVNDRYYLRVLGGENLARLDLLNASDAETDAAIDQYVGELEAQMANLSTAHSEGKAAGTHTSAGDALNGKCIADATDIMLNKMMYSVPASKVYNAFVKNKSPEDARAHLKAAVQGSEQMISLFYQHKGMIDGGSGSNATPNRHLNIRYMEMFTGAFMYAAGNHIGVGFNESANFQMLKPFDANGTGGMYFGWGSAHEIGHNINDGRYAFAEVTNNYFAQLCKSLNENGATRWNYRGVYDHVTSGAEAHAGGQATQLAMYWQLMLAYDTAELHTLFTQESELLANRFFARVDSFSRNPNSFTGSVPLTLSTEQQNIIRLASAAAGKDLTDFFEAWGFHADATTKAFVKQFADAGNVETRAIQYINDSLANRSASTQPTIPSTAAASEVLSVEVDPQGSTVHGTITPAAAHQAAVHGFEVTRVSYEMGNEVRQVVKFVTAGADGSYTFADDAASLGNRAVHYEVCAVDKQLYRSKAAVTQPIMLEGTGLYDAAEWDVTTNMTSPADANDVIVDSTTVEQNGSYQCSGFDDETAADPEAKTVKAVNGVLSGDGYTGKTAEGDPYVVIDMKAVRAVEHLTYVPKTARNITEYKVELSQTGADSDWIEPASGTLSYNAEGTKAEIFFPKRTTVGGTVDYVNTEYARYIKLTASGKGTADWDIQQVQVYGLSGDKINLAETIGEGEHTTPAIGVLEADYVLEKDAQGNVTSKIPAGSIVFVGEFKGNPAYSNVILFGTTSRGTMIVGGTTTNDQGEEVLVAKQAILAPNPGPDALGETRSGSWIYWIENANDLEDGMTVRAELYRVDNAFTNQGQRMTSDSLPVTIPSISGLPKITLTDDNVDDGTINQTVAL